MLEHWVRFCRKNPNHAPPLTKCVAAEVTLDPVAVGYTELAVASFTLLHAGLAEELASCFDEYVTNVYDAWVAKGEKDQKQSAPRGGTPALSAVDLRVMGPELLAEATLPEHVLRLSEAVKLFEDALNSDDKAIREVAVTHFARLQSHLAAAPAPLALEGSQRKMRKAIERATSLNKRSVNEWDTQKTELV